MKKAKKWTATHAEILENYIDLLEGHAGRSYGEAKEVITLIKSCAEAYRRAVNSKFPS